MKNQTEYKTITRDSLELFNGDCDLLAYNGWCPMYGVVVNLVEIDSDDTRDEKYKLFYTQQWMKVTEVKTDN